MQHQQRTSMPLLKYSGVAELLSVCESTVRNLVREPDALITIRSFYAQGIPL